MAMYKKGGTAIDAAVAAALALGVVEPQNSGLGGGGFMLIYNSSTDTVTAIDYRESASALAKEKIYKNKSSVIGYSASAVPGLINGLNFVLSRYGTLPLHESIEPALKLAREGFKVSPILAKRLINRGNCLGRFSASRKVFFRKSQPLKKGSLLVQEDLANTLEDISKNGALTFYNGSIAQKIEAAMKKGGGLIRKSDLNAYSTKERTPIAIHYRDHTIYTMPPPSSGGIVMAQMFQMIQADPLQQWGWSSPQEAHLLTEVMKSAFADRSRYLGDSDFAPIPEKLTSLGYAQKKRSQIKTISMPEGTQTTHASFADHEGNIVSMTNSLNLPFGSCVVIPGTGILMNNHMDDFVTRPNKPNAFGLIQGKANKIEPGKRPLSSMSPSIVFKDNKPIYALGSPGGPTIISNIFQVIINLLDHRMTLERAISAPKLHHQYLPDRLYYQESYPLRSLDTLQELGNKLEYRLRWGNVQAVRINHKTGRITGVADPRGEGKFMTLDRLDVSKPNQ
jgi:gamma-glutamyltranspeptidase/glutathione hydrolase